MPDSSKSSFYCDLDAIETASKLYTEKIEKMQAIYTALLTTMERVTEEKLLEGQYYDSFLEKFTVIEEGYYRVVSVMMVLNISLGNVNFMVEPLIEARDVLSDYL